MGCLLTVLQKHNYALKCNRFVQNGFVSEVYDYELAVEVLGFQHGIMHIMEPKILEGTAISLDFATFAKFFLCEEGLAAEVLHLIHNFVFPLQNLRYWYN